MFVPFLFHNLSFVVVRAFVFELTPAIFLKRESVKKPECLKAILTKSVCVLSIV